MSIDKQLKVKAFHIAFEVLIAGCGIILVVANSENPLLVTVGVVTAVSALFSYICAEIELKNEEREVIDKEKKENEDKKRRYYTNIFNDLKPLLQIQIDLFTQMFKATTDKRPSQIYQDISKFFDENFYITINRLDYLQKAPIGYIKDNRNIEVSWVEYIEQEYLKFEAKLQDAKTVLNVANLKDDHVLNLIETILKYGSNYEYMATMNRLEDASKTDNFMAVFFLKNAFWRNKTWLEVYIESVVTFANVYNLICDKKIKINFHIWEEDCSPRLGSSIKKKEYYRVEERNGDKYLKKIE